MSDKTPKPKVQKSLPEQAAHLDAQEARFRARKMAVLSKQREHSTARVRRLGEALLVAAEPEDCPFTPYKDLIDKVDAEIELEAQLRREATQKKKAARES